MKQYLIPPIRCKAKDLPKILAEYIKKEPVLTHRNAK